jgi:methionyl-tRNA formyltransferase
LHYSLLPKLRGAAPVQAAIKQGLQETGISIFQLDEGMDTGNIFMKIPAQIQPGENSARLLSRLTELGVSGLLELLPSIAAGFANATAQDSSEATFAPKITRGDARIFWTAECRTIENLINAMNPEPVAWTVLRNESFRVLEARTSLLSFADSHPGYPAGTVYESGTKVLVACKGADALELLVVQPAGKNAMSANDWLRGQKEKGQIVFE